jgi:hypothetical protein
MRVSSEDSAVDSENLTDANVQAAILKTYAARAFMVIVRSPGSAKMVVRPGSLLLPSLLKEYCTQPVRTLADTVGMNFLEQRRSHLRRYCYETRTGAIIPLDANPPEVQKEQPMSEKEKARLAMAEQLMSMQIHQSKELRLYLHGIEENDDDFNRSLDWFLSGAADAALQGDVLASKTSAEEAALYPDEHIPRWEKAHQIAQMVGMPAKMCFQFLEVSRGGDMNTAAGLVMQYGTKHLSGLEKDKQEEASHAGLGGSGTYRNRIDDAQCRGVDDSAPLSDMTSIDSNHGDDSGGDEGRRTRRRSRRNGAESKDDGSSRALGSGGDEDSSGGITSEERERMFEAMCETLSGIENPARYLRVSELPSTTVAMSDASQTMVSADALLPGQRVIVMNTALSRPRPRAQVSGRVKERNAILGVIAAHSMNGNMLRVLTLDRHTGLSYVVDVLPAHQVVYAISELAGRNITELEHIRAAVLSTEQALAKMYSRRAIVSLAQCHFDSGVRLNMDGQAVNFDQTVAPQGAAGKIDEDVDAELGRHYEMAHLIFEADHMQANASRICSKLFLRFLKLSAASENIFIRGSSLFPHLVETPVTKLLRRKLKSLITNEVQRKQRKQGHEGLESKTNPRLKDPFGIVQAATTTSSEHVAMSKILINECIENLKDSTTPGPGTDASTRDSLHPVFPTSDYIDSVFMDGAKMLWVLFDPRCETKHGATLSFYQEQDPGCRGRPIAQFSGDSSQFMPFVVPGGKVYFRFTSNKRVSGDGDGEAWGCGWGYRFQVRPLRGLSWTREVQTQNPSLEWACWLLEFLLNDVADLGSGIVHNKVSILFTGYKKEDPSRFSPLLYISVLFCFLSFPHVKQIRPPPPQPSARVQRDGRIFTRKGHSVQTSDHCTAHADATVTHKISS